MTARPDYEERERIRRANIEGLRAAIERREATRMAKSAGTKK